jgi:hypothetical protein
MWGHVSMHDLATTTPIQRLAGRRLRPPANSTLCKRGHCFRRDSCRSPYGFTVGPLWVQYGFTMRPLSSGPIVDPFMDPFICVPMGPLFTMSFFQPIERGARALERGKRSLGRGGGQSAEQSRLPHAALWTPMDPLRIPHGPPYGSPMDPPIPYGPPVSDLYRARARFYGPPLWSPIWPPSQKHCTSVWARPFEPAGSSTRPRCDA